MYSRVDIGSGRRKCYVGCFAVQLPTSDLVMELRVELRP